MGLGNVAQLVEPLPDMHEAPSLIPSIAKNEVWCVHSQSQHSGGSEAQSHPQLHTVSLRPTWAI